MADTRPATDSGENGAETASGGMALPIEAGSLRVDDTGFHGTVEVPWENVLGVVATAGVLEIQAAGPEGFAEIVARARVDASTARAIEASWRSRVMSELAGGKPLKGTLLARFRVLPPLLWATGTILLIWAIASLAVSIGVSQSAAETSPLGSSGVIVGGGVVCAVALATAAVMFITAIRYRRLVTVWKRWELDVEGLRVWPDGERRRVLKPLAADFISPRIGTIDGEYVPLAWMTGYGMATRLLMAMGRRAEATIARDSYGELIVVPLLCAVLWCMALAAHFAMPGKMWIHAMVFGVACVATATWMVGLTRSRKRLRTFFLDGRSMIERLNW
jgi:hypothetical protein